MHTQPHLEKNVTTNYYADQETGEFLGHTTDDFDPSKHETTFIKISNTTYNCPNCNYTGPRYHPYRRRPTLDAQLKKICPNCHTTTLQHDN